MFQIRLTEDALVYSNYAMAIFKVGEVLSGEVALAAAAQGVPHVALDAEADADTEKANPRRGRPRSEA